MVFIKDKKEQNGILQQDLRTVNMLIKEIKIAKTEEEANIRAAIVTGYANAMYLHGILDKKEIEDILAITEEVTVKQYKAIAIANELAAVLKGKNIEKFDTMRMQRKTV